MAPECADHEVRGSLLVLIAASIARAAAVGLAPKLQHLLEEACKFKMRANTTAQMLAPYVHPKMEASPQRAKKYSLM